MNYYTFHKYFETFPVITQIEVQKAFPNLDKNTLTRWQKAQYLEKLRNGVYRFTNQKLTSEPDYFLIANKMYYPSYVSLESALHWHGIIPEGVFTITSVSTKKTCTQPTPVGHFTYAHLKPSLFFGYNMVPVRNHVFLIAEPEKCILDYLYLHSEVKSMDVLEEELRWNAFELREKLNWEKIQNYLSLYQNQQLNRRVQTLRAYLSRYDDH